MPVILSPALVAHEGPQKIVWTAALVMMSPPCQVILAELVGLAEWTTPFAQWTPRAFDSGSVVGSYVSLDADGESLIEAFCAFSARVANRATTAKTGTILFIQPQRLNLFGCFFLGGTKAKKKPANKCR